MEFVAPIQAFEELTGGGLGQVLKCRDGAGTVFVAKFPKDGSPEAQRLIFDEERRLQRFQFTRVVKYLGRVVHSDGRLGFAMELLEEALSASIRRLGEHSEIAVLRLLAGPTEGLLQIHASATGAFHGDIKPANMLRAGKSAKLADFGLARGGAGQTQMLGPHTGGTPGYFPPEGYASPAGDVYSLGATMWALLAGREPVPGERLEAPPTASAGVQCLLADMLRPEPAPRAVMADVDARLKKLLAEAEARRDAWLRPLKAVVAVACVTLVAVAMVWGISKLVRRR